MLDSRHIVFYNSLSLSNLQNTPDRPDITGQIQLLQQFCQFATETGFAIDLGGGDFVVGNEDGGREKHFYVSHIEGVLISRISSNNGKPYEILNTEFFGP